MNILNKYSLLKEKYKDYEKNKKEIKGFFFIVLNIINLYVVYFNLIIQMEIKITCSYDKTMKVIKIIGEDE